MRIIFNYISISIFSILLLVFNPSFAQEVVKDSTLVNETIVEEIEEEVEEIDGTEKELDEENEEESDKKKKKERKNKLEKVAQPYIAIGTDFGTSIFRLSMSNSQEYSLFSYYSWREKMYFKIKGGWGKESIDYDHLKYNTHGAFLQLVMDYNILKFSHEKDKDRLYVGPFISGHWGQNSEAEFLIKNNTGFEMSDKIDGNSYFKAVIGANIGTEVEILRNVLLSWNGQVGILLGANKFKGIKPHFMPGYGNADNSVQFLFGVNLAYYFHR